MGFYDSKGYWRNDGDGFYDAKGNWVDPGCGFYDSKGYFRSQGDGFYDAKGNWVNPGGAFYDSKGYIRTNNSVISRTEEAGKDVGIAIVFILLMPIALLWMMTTFLIEWIVSHAYIVFIGYAIIDAVLCFVITKMKKHQGVKFALSFVGNYICLMSLIYITLVYAVPYVTMNKGSFVSIFNFTLVLALGIGVIAVIQFLNYYHENAILESILGIGFFIMVVILLKNGTKEMNTLESLAELYNLETSTIFKILFGFVTY